MTTFSLEHLGGSPRVRSLANRGRARLAARLLLVDASVSAARRMATAGSPAAQVRIAQRFSARLDT